MSDKPLTPYVVMLQRAWERAELAVKMRQDGATFREIGERLCVTREWARCIVRKHERQLREGRIAPADAYRAKQGK